MKIQKTTRITIEEQRLLTVSVGQGHILKGFCEQCGMKRAVFTPEIASAILRVSGTDIGGLTEAARIHVVEMGNGTSLICGHSLMGSSR